MQGCGSVQAEVVPGPVGAMEGITPTNNVNSLDDKDVCNPGGKEVGSCAVAGT